MVIDIYGDALRLLEHFIYSAKKNVKVMSTAMCYDELCFCVRLRHLENLLREAEWHDNYY